MACMSRLIGILALYIGHYRWLTILVLGLGLGRRSSRLRLSFGVSLLCLQLLMVMSAVL